MRLVKLRWKNINSLAGEFSIDFEDRAYRESGIFAITGPTGSGKTSILDAVSLALYGKTPRSAKLAGSRRDQDGEKCMMMTKGRTECSAAVIFEAGGVYYLSRWSQRLAAKSGRLQSVQVELVRLTGPDDAAGEVVAEQVNAWRAAVDRVTGLTFETFCCSVMLAQGAFAALLRADVNERADILERITGTQIYSRVGIRIYERAKEAAEELAVLERRFGDAKILPAEERMALEVGVRELKDEIELRGREVQMLQTHVEHRRRRTEEERKVERARNALASALEAGARAKVEREQAERARRAAAPAREARERDEAERRFEAAQAALAAAECSVKAAREAAQTSEVSARGAEQALAVLEASELAFRPEAEAMRAADAEIRHLKKTESEAAERRKAAEGRRDAAKKSADAAEAVRAAVEERVKRAEEFCVATACEEKLRAALPSVLEAVDLHRDAHKSCDAAKKEFDDAQKRVAENERAFEENQAARRKALARCNEAKGALQARERELEVAMAGRKLEASLLEMRRAADRCSAARWAAVLAQESDFVRSALAAPEGRAPGAFADYLAAALARLQAYSERLRGEWPEVFEDLSPEGIAKFEGSIAELRNWSRTAGEALALRDKAQDELAAARGALDRIEAFAGALELRAKAEREALEKREEDWKTAAEALEAARKAYLEAVTPFVPEETVRSLRPKALFSVLSDRIAARDAALESQRTEREALERARTACEGAQKFLDEQARQAAEACADDKAAREKRAMAEKERSERWGSRNPEFEAKALEAQLAAGRKAAAEAKDAELRARLAAAAADAKQKAAVERRALAEREVIARREVFAKVLEASGFESEDAMKNAWLTEARIQELEAGVEMAERVKLEASATLAAAQETLSTLVAAAPESWVETEAVWSARAAEARAALNAALEASGRLSEQLRTDDAVRSEGERLACEIERMRPLVADWRRLAELAGDAAGKTLRRAAQRLTFALLLEGANGVLSGMRSRYRLEPTGETGLEVSVRDEDLAGTLRTSANLSGGETFLVSLALALSLSRISTRNLRVDTLFLDEGFGSLDPTTLEKALSALETLQRGSRKLIGLISHVRAVSERIPVHISVRPKGATGESDVSGPGVLRIA